MLLAASTAAARRSVEVVSPGANPIVGGNALLRALDRITSASDTEPWLLKIEPGVYDLGVQVLVMKPFVDMEGSGQGVTTITSEGVNTAFAASDAEIRDLTIQNTFPGPPGPSCTSPTNECHAVIVGTGADARIVDTTLHTTSGSFPIRVRDGGSLNVQGGSITCADFCHAVQTNSGGTATLQGTTITALEFLSRGADAGGTINLVNVRIDVGNVSTKALQAVGASAVINAHNSIVRGEHVLVLGGEVNIGTSQVELFGTTTGATCVASYDENFNPVGPDCLPLP
jgi:hypothetical protein